MGEKYFLAVDIGASSGRHILFHKEEGRLQMQEIYRFENGMKEEGGHLIWDKDHLLGEIKAGMKKAGELGMAPVSMSIDTWGVDYVLLDENDEPIGPCYGYRDSRTEGTDAIVEKTISEADLYGIAGIGKQPYNTVYQLIADLRDRPEDLKRAKTYLSLPDYFAFYLTGKKANEYSEATTTGLINAAEKNWDRKLIASLGLPADIFQDVSFPGTELGKIREEIAAEVGYSCSFVLCPTHDTASAVMAMPDPTGKGLYISSGTWSLMGVLSDEPVTAEAARADGFTNEGGYGGQITFLKNIMGLWMIQSVRHELNDGYSFRELADLGVAEKDFPATVDVNDLSFLAPKSMTKAIQEYCRKGGMKVPETPGQLSAVIVNSLAKCYADTAKEIEELTGEHFPCINVLGGGGQNVFLNEATCRAAGKPVNAGPTEATAIGNALAQMISFGEFGDLSEARTCVKASFEVKSYDL